MPRELFRIHGSPYAWRLQSTLRASSKEAARSFDLPFLGLAERRPNIHAWMGRIHALPGYETTYPPNWR